MAIGSIAMLCAVLSAPAISFAHERRTIGGGKYDVVVGWDTEPAYVGEKNAAGIRISEAGTNPAVPMIDADKTLKLDIRQGADTRAFSLRAVFGQPGYYVVDILPTRDGHYQWTLNGSIGSVQVAEKFDSADGRFDAVKTATDLQFPVALPDAVQLQAEAQRARATAESAQTVAYIGFGSAVLALLAAIGVWLTRPRGRLMASR